MIPSILIPIIGGLLIPLFPKGSEKIRNIFAGVVSSLPILFIVAMMPGVLASPSAVKVWELPMFRSISLLLLGDAL